MLRAVSLPLSTPGANIFPDAPSRDDQVTELLMARTYPREGFPLTDQAQESGFKIHYRPLVNGD
jgi:hypothetical protein